MKTPTLFRALAVTLPLLTGGCQTITDGANKIGSYMPTIGERCEHWECMTTTGKAKSEQIKRARAMRENPPTGPQNPQGAGAPGVPVPAGQPPMQPADIVPPPEPMNGIPDGYYNPEDRGADTGGYYK